MAEEDELEFNPMFIALQTTFSSTYLKAQDDCYVICIPHSECIQGSRITKKFVETHILIPSKLYKSKYSTVLTDDQCVSLEDNGEYLYTEKGFPVEVRAKILSEELGYNKDYKPYKMLIIDKSLDETLLTRASHLNVTVSGEFSQKLTVKECQEFLQGYSEFDKPLRELEAEIHKFNHNYVIVNGFLDDVMTRLNTISESSAEGCIGSLPKSQPASYKFKDAIRSCVETYMIGSVYNKLYPGIWTEHAEEDQLMVSKCQRLQGLTPDLLKVPDALCCPLPSAVVELAHIDGMVTPVQKLFCLKSTLDSITNEIEAYIKKEAEESDSVDYDAPSLTPDDLIPILVTVIVQARCQHIYSDIYYMENFYWAAGTKDRDNLSYCLVTFKAAVEYMRCTDFSDIDLKQNRADTELNMKDLYHVQKSQFVTTDVKPSSSRQDDRRPRTYSKTRHERQMENINKMFDEAALGSDLSTSKNKAPVVTSVFGGSYTPQAGERDQANKGQKGDLGDFLSNLENDFSFSCGKQT